MEHHPPLVETGELEIAQRRALHEAHVAAHAAHRGSIANSTVQRAIDAYLRAMRLTWQPGPIVISESDHVELDFAGARLDVHAVDGQPVVRHRPTGHEIEIEIAIT